MKTGSLTRRTIAVVLLAELVCAAAFSGSALLHERRARLHSFDVMLQGRSDSLLGAVQDAEDPEENVTIDPSELSLPPHDVYAVYVRDGRLLGGSPSASPELIERQGTGIREANSGRHHYRVFERNGMRIIDRAENGVAGLRRPITIVYASSTDHLWHEIFEAVRFYVLVSLCLLALTAILLIVLLRRVLEPIDDLAAQAAGVSAASLHFEAPESALRIRELRPLAEALTAAIGGLRQALEHEKRFVSDASHELKTAVAVVRSTLQVLMMRTRSREEYAEGLDRLLEDNQRVEDLVSRMLTLARVETEAASASDSCDLAAAVREAAGKLRSFAEAHSVELVTEIDGPAQVRSTAERMDVLVSNLIVNAVQHSPSGARVEVSMRIEGQTAQLLVRDQGLGIAPDALPHVFERFYREDTSRSRNTGGAGLGLAICKSIVEGASGSIAIESTTGAGTTGAGTRVQVSFSLT